jgi:hypothetical protein
VTGAFKEINAMKKKESKKMDEFELWKNKAEYEFRIICEKITTLPGQEGTDEKIKRLTFEALETDLLADQVLRSYEARELCRETYKSEIGNLDYLLGCIFAEIEELGGNLTLGDLDKMKDEKGFVVKAIA